jgi:hypothetical protein
MKGRASHRGREIKFPAGCSSGPFQFVRESSKLCDDLHDREVIVKGALDLHALAVVRAQLEGQGV